MRGAQELRVKESDRLDAMAQGLNILGVVVETFDDGIKITGGQMGGGTVDSFGDHRIAMAFTVAGLRSESCIRYCELRKRCHFIPELRRTRQESRHAGNGWEVKKTNPLMSLE